ncbi:vWA domain-containing protein, partial [Gemella cuniculi]|uniref:vWA domain-containing protein n=1 Tax=Gemella cuniculi TaxID=150240 RepID=UPI00055840A7
MNSNKFNKVITYSLRKNKIGLTSTAIIFSILGTAGTIQKEVKAVEAKQEINTSSSQHNEKGNSTLDSVKESNVENTTNKNNEKTLLAQKEITKEDSIQKDSEKQKTFSTTTETDIATIKRTYEQQNSPDTWKVKTEIIKKEIDHGADIVALLDTSSHMKENGRLEQAKKLLETLSSHILGGNNKNKLSLIVFNSDTKNIVDFTDDINKIKEHINSDSTSVKKHEEAFLQKAIHQASELLQKQDSQRSKHIVMLSYGKSNYSYDFKKSDKEVPTGSLQKVNTIHKLLGLFPYKVNHTRHNVGELQAIAKLFNINVGDIESLAKLGSLFLPNLDYVQLNETKPTENTDFDYDKRVGDGTDAHTYKGYKKNGEISTPVKNLIAKYLKEFSPFEKLNDFFKSSEYKKKNKDKKDFFDNLTTNFDPVQNIGGRLGNWLFKPHSLTFYNHNNSALAETNKAKAKGIKFHSIDVDNANTDYDKFLKDISSEKNFLTLTNQKETAKTFEKKLTTIELKDELPAGTTLTQGPTVNKGNAKFNNSNSSLWSLFSSSKPNVTWKFEKDDLVDNSPLSLEYTIKLKDDNKNKTLSSTFSYRLEDKSSTVKLPDQVFSLDKKEKDIPQTPKNEDDKDKNDKPKVEDNKGQDKNQKPEV